ARPPLAKVTLQSPENLAELPFLVDSHAHLDAEVYDPDRQEVMQRALAEGVRFVLAVGSDVESSRRTVEIAAAYDPIYAAVGVHPHEVKNTGRKTLSALSDMSSHPKVVAIGEIGLDYHYNHSTPKLQRHWFREQIRLAVKLKKPVIVHCRDAGEDIFQILEEEKAWHVGGVVHCFTGDAELARKLIGLDFYLGAAGPITFEKSDELREVFAGVPIERVLIETDSPYLAPPPARGQRNEPALVARVAETLAEIYGLTTKDVARITSRNVSRLFGIGNGAADTIAYTLGERLYINITNQCSNACFFCGLLSDKIYKGYDLTLSAEPSAEEILRAAGEAAGYEEVVFSGFGEPTLRLDVLKEVAAGLRERGARKIRLVTNGLGSRTNERDIIPELHGLVDALSVSLQADTAENYEKICKTKDIEDPYPSIKAFIRAAKLHFREVEVTAVHMPGMIDAEGCARVAREELDVPFRSQLFVLAD
ncbi:MAG: YchF/TatD family DNA exonuclease, partial [bacterium]|nr:YchF/TatD family DNA exonuclease [bacterium]